MIEKVALSLNNHMLPAERLLRARLDHAVEALRSVVSHLLPHGTAR
jgi:hypothetical protein